ncbi:MAG: hypothetical protein ACOC46_01090 [Pirellulales bacterium]
MFTGSKKVKLDKSLYERLTKVAQQAGYSSTDEFIVHVLEKEAAGADQADDDLAEVEKRLRGLGYIE